MTADTNCDIASLLLLFVISLCLCCQILRDGCCCVFCNLL